MRGPVDHLMEWCGREVTILRQRLNQLRTGQLRIISPESGDRWEDMTRYEIELIESKIVELEAICRHKRELNAEGAEGREATG